MPFTFARLAGLRCNAWPVRPSPLPTELAHALEDKLAIAIHAVGAALQRQGQNCGEPSRIFAADIPGWDSVIVVASGFSAINAGAPLDYIEIKLEDPPLAEDHLGDRDKRELGGLAEVGAFRTEEEVFYQLLSNRGPAANAPALHIIFRGNFDRVPVESMMLIEARVFSGDDGVLQVGRNLAEWNEFVALVIGLVVNPGLHAALHVNSGGGRINPPGSHKHQDPKRPKEGDADEKPSGESSEQVPPTRSLEGCVWIFSHTSE